MKSRTESIQEEIERGEEEIRLKVESILAEEDEYVREEMILGLDEDELEAFNEALGKIEEEDCKEGFKERLFEMGNVQHKEYIFSVRTNDHEPPHFHFIEKGLFDARISLEDFSFMSLAYGEMPTSSDFRNMREWLQQTKKIGDGQEVKNSTHLWVLWDTYHS